MAADETSLLRSPALSTQHFPSLKFMSYLQIVFFPVFGISDAVRTPIPILFGLFGLHLPFSPLYLGFTTAWFSYSLLSRRYELSRTKFALNWSLRVLNCTVKTTAIAMKNVIPHTSSDTFLC